MHQSTTMENLNLSNEILDKYFGYLKKMDVNAKKNFIHNFSKSIETKSNKEFDTKSFFGAWEDEKVSEEIITDF